MKPTSVIFLVISALLIVGGLILCSTAEDIALADNYTLFHSSEDGGTYVREDFDASVISKIELLVTDAQIHIITGSEEAYVEFINFRDGLYTLSNSGNVLSMDEIPDLRSIFSLQSGFSFSGMRYILRAGTADLGEKRINIYLPQNTALKVLSVEADNCVIYADGIYSQFDIQVDAGESAELHASNLRTACSLTLEAQELNVDVYSCYLHSISLTAQTAQVQMQEIYWDNVKLSVEKGELELLSTIVLFRYEYDVRGGGSFILNDESVSLPYQESQSANPLGSVSGNIGHASLTLSEIVD